jgi:very-short-patch-repair endonuclease
MNDPKTHSHKMKEWYKNNPEAAQKRALAIREANKRPEIIEKRRLSALKSYTPEVKEKHRIAMLNRYKDPAEREKTKQITIERYKDPKEHERTSLKNKERWANNDRRKAQSEAMKKVWANPEYKKQTVAKTVRALHKSPNIPETMLINILDTYYPNEWVFIGNNDKEGIDGKLPDFKHTKHKWIIEHFSDYHHSYKNKTIKYHQTYDGRTEFLAKRGYKTLILWDSEVKKQPVEYITNKIQEMFYSK